MNTQFKKPFSRHGDVLIEAIDLSANTEFAKRIAGYSQREVSSIVAALGEVTGHKHVINKIINDNGVSSSIIEYFNNDENPATRDEIIFEVRNGEACIIHDDHNVLIFKEGIHSRKIQKEYDFFKEEMRRAID